MTLYTAGTLVTITGKYWDITGLVLTDPTAASVTFGPVGSATFTTVTPTKASTGIYTAEIDTTGYGAVEVIYEFDGTGTCQTAGQKSFWTQPSLL